MTDVKLSPTMRQCVAYIREHGAIHRHQGGFWAKPDWVLHHGIYFDGSTMNALVTRKVVEYTEWRDGRGGKFPIKAALCSALPGDGCL
jgi:hypothetical protein